MKHLVVFLLLIPHQCISQYLLEASTVYNDSFREWSIIGESYDKRKDGWYDTEGSISLTFGNRNDWTSWQIELDDVDVECRLKWTNNPNLWVIHTPDDLISIRTVWKDDFRKWKITSSTHTISIKSRYANLSDEWVLESRSIGQWKMYTDSEGDPRQWIIEDELNESVDMYHKLAMSFAVLIHSSPRI